MPNGPPTRAGQPKYIFTRRLLVSHPPTRIAMSVLWSKYSNRTHLLTLYAIRPPKQNSTYNGTPQQAINMRLQLELCVLLLCYQLLHNMRQVLCDFWCFPYVTSSRNFWWLKCIERQKPKWFTKPRKQHKRGNGNNRNYCDSRNPRARMVYQLRTPYNHFDK